MSTEVTLPTSFKDIVRERILSTFMDLIPKEEIDRLVEKEIKDFFETEVLLTVNPTKVEIKNPQFEPTKRVGYGNEPTLTRECLAFGSQMTPFRQLVWSTLHQVLQPRLVEILTDDTSQVKKDLDTWFEETATPDLTKTNKALFSHIAIGMSAGMLRSVLYDAVDSSHQGLINSLGAVGVNPSAIPRTGGVFTTPKY